MLNCNRCNGNRLCPHYIISESVTIVPVGGVDTLVIDLPAGNYENCGQYCIVVRTLPANVTVNMPVAISIGGVTTTVYPLICGRTGLQAVGCQVSGRSRIKTTVRTNRTSGVFRACDGLNPYCPDVLTSLPAPTAPAPATVSVERATTATVRAAKPKTADNVTISANTVTVNKEAK